MLVSLTNAAREATDQERGGVEIYESFWDEEREALGGYLNRICVSSRSRFAGDTQCTPLN
ncbi:MAG: hypothetical protein Q3974_00525 [Rothia sp. (in: high G+C Gram-positive bacteria)]|nr:hypothetical protein [Rothia sp. (in: high G+C Gram-positive bacteria)]